MLKNLIFYALETTRKIKALSLGEAQAKEEVEKGFHSKWFCLHNNINNKSLHFRVEKNSLFENFFSNEIQKKIYFRF